MKKTGSVNLVACALCVFIYITTLGGAGYRHRQNFARKSVLQRGRESIDVLATSLHLL